MRPFSKLEIIGTAFIFLILIGISAPNFIVSIRRARDQVRRDDLGSMTASLEEYFGDFGVFPKSVDSKILACKNLGDTVAVDAKGRLLVNLTACQWGKDALVDLTPGSSKVYIKPIPADPRTGQGFQYAYFSDGERFQIYAAFEGKDEIGYDPKIIARNITCGTKVCNYGRSFDVPLNISIEEYTAQLQNAKIKK